jgi:ketosteroid isomerase-like protein
MPWQDSQVPTDDLRSRRDAAIREHMRSENEHEFDATIATFSSPKYELVPTGHVIEGEEAVRTYYRASRQLVPDQRNELIALHHAGDAAIVEFWLRGTYHGSATEAPPSGRAFECRMCAIFEFAPSTAGIVSERVYWDQHTIRAQLMGEIVPVASADTTE